MTDTKAYFRRQMILPQVGEQGQQKLQEASVLVIGAGGLGCPVLQYLSAAGLRKITLVDGDKIHATNIHRQVLFAPADVGRFKAEVAAEKLKSQYPWLEINAVAEFLTKENAGALISGADVVADCTDNFDARYLVNDLCVEHDKPFVSASVLQWEGQLSVYNYKGGPTYRCLFPDRDPAAESCEEAGVMGMLTGIMGTMQALEIVKVILGMEEVLSGKLLRYNALTGEHATIRFERNEAAWKTSAKSNLKEENELELPDNFFLVDVREAWEHEERNVGGANIPFGKIPEMVDEFIAMKRPVVLYCESGKKSAAAASLLLEAGIAVQSCSIKELNSLSINT